MNFGKVSPLIFPLHYLSKSYLTQVIDYKHVELVKEIEPRSARGSRPRQKEDSLTLLGLPSISDYISAVMLVSPPLESLYVRIFRGSQAGMPLLAEAGRELPQSNFRAPA